MTRLALLPRLIGDVSETSVTPAAGACVGVAADCWVAVGAAATVAVAWTTCGVLLAVITGAGVRVGSTWRVALGCGRCVAALVAVLANVADATIGAASVGAGTPSV